MPPSSGSSCPTLNTEALRFSETPVTIYQSTGCKIPEDSKNINSKILQILKFLCDKTQNKMEFYFSFKYAITTKPVG